MYADEEVFKNKDFRVEELKKGEYDNCRFIACNFAGISLSDVIFLECEFEQCDLSMTNVANTAFRDIEFSDCKILGVDFSQCNSLLFGVRFRNCQLNLASFHKLKMKATSFKNCQLQEVDFVETDLTSAVFSNCDLLRATFDFTILEKADFRTATNYSIHPEQNRIKKAKFSLPGAVGLLDHLDIDVQGV